MSCKNDRKQTQQRRCPRDSQLHHPSRSTSLREDQSCCKTLIAELHAQSSSCGHFRRDSCQVLVGQMRLGETPLHDARQNFRSAACERRTAVTDPDVHLNRAAGDALKYAPRPSSTGECFRSTRIKLRCYRSEQRGARSSRRSLARLAAYVRQLPGD
jgi:hypothetical protein